MDALPFASHPNRRNHPLCARLRCAKTGRPTVAVQGTGSTAAGSAKQSASFLLESLSSAPLLEQLLSGQDIRSHLSGCTDCILLAATLGAQVDALIRRAQVRDMEQALWLDAAASAAIEEVCDTAQRQIAEQLGQSLTHRFSCGYGDLPLSIQPQLCTLLDSTKSIGLSVSHSSMLTPVKSVTAILGILPAGTVASAPKPCTICHLKENCVLRRKGVFCGKSTD